MSLMVHVEPTTGRPMLLPRPKVAAGGGGGGGRSTSLATVVSSDPASGTDGELIYNTTESALKIWITDAWVTIGTGADLASFNLETGDELLLETGDFILTE